MKFKTCVLAVVCLVATLCVFCVPVQAQEEVPLSFFVEEVRVIPDKVGKYEEFVKKFVGICQQYNWTFSMSTYVTMDNLFYFLYPAKSHSDVDQIFKSWNAIIDKYGGEKWQAFMQNYADCFEYMKFGMIHRLPELCYTPKVVAPGEEPFTYWGYLFVKPGMEKDVEAIFKEFVKLFQDKKTPNAFNFRLLTSAIIKLGINVSIQFLCCRLWVRTALLFLCNGWQICIRYVYKGRKGS